MKNNKKTLKFPKNFLWGVSTSAYQIEGGIVNDWSLWETSAERRGELCLKDENQKDFFCGQAVDSYNRYKEDAELVKKLNCRAYRFSIEWSRVEPEPSKFDFKEIKHYRDQIKFLKSLGIEPVVTLWHWTNPLWISNQGGWTKKSTVDYYAAYVKMVVSKLGDEVKYWITLNEPMVHVANGYLTGKFPPAKKSPRQGRRAFKNLVIAHKRAYDIIHHLRPHAEVSITQLVNHIEPISRWNPIAFCLAKLSHRFWNHKFLKRIKNKLDFIGFDYYFHDRVNWRPPFIKNKNKQTTDMGWEIYPEGIYQVLKYLSSFKKPLYVMENGLADKDDKYREDFIREHLRYVHKAIQEGVDVRGYFYWSLLDNFEWAHGFGPKFGLYKVDRKTFKRTSRPSVEFYKKVCKENKIIC